MTTTRTRQRGQRGRRLTYRQRIVARQVREFWQERNLIPSVSAKRSIFVHGVKHHDPDRQAICASSDKKLDLVEARGLALLKPICRRCLRQHIYNETGIFLPPWW